MWRALTLLGGAAAAALPSEYGDYVQDAPYPTTLTLRKEDRLDAAAVRALYRDAYKGSPYDLASVSSGAGRSGMPLPYDVVVPIQTRDGETVTGAWERPIAMLRTQLAVVVEGPPVGDVLAMPPPGSVFASSGHAASHPLHTRVRVSAQPIVLWMCPHTPYGGSYTPLRVSLPSAPAAIGHVDVTVYDMSSLFWLHRTVTNLLLGLHSTAAAIVQSTQLATEASAQAAADAWLAASPGGSGPPPHHSPYHPSPSSSSGSSRHLSESLASAGDASLASLAHSLRASAAHAADDAQHGGPHSTAHSAADAGERDRLSAAVDAMDGRPDAAVHTWSRLVALIMITASDGYTQQFTKVRGHVPHGRGNARYVALNETAASVGYSAEYLRSTPAFLRGVAIPAIPEP